MPLKLDAGEIVELAWWWEEPPAGRLLELRDVAVVRGLLGRWCGRAVGVGALRGFVARGEAWEVGRVGDGELFERVAAAVVRGRIRVGVAAREALGGWDGEEEEAPVGEKVIAALKEELAKEDICWPCLLKAMASARTLIEAAKNGTPFISNGPLKEAPKKKAEPKKDDICWPCLLQAMASAEALIAAAKSGTPFVGAGRKQ